MLIRKSLQESFIIFYFFIRLAVMFGLAYFASGNKRVGIVCWNNFYDNFTRYGIVEFYKRMGIEKTENGLTVAISVTLTALALFGFSVSSEFWILILSAIPYGLGCAPVYPCIIHMTPTFFGKEKSQTMMGVQIAFAYFGICIVPPVFGVIADYLTVALLPAFLTVIFVIMAVMHETVVYKTKTNYGVNRNLSEDNK